MKRIALLLLLFFVATCGGLMAFAHFTRKARMQEINATDTPENVWMNISDEQRELIRKSWKQ